jgi:SAM-dependent methyltransferase
MACRHCGLRFFDPAPVGDGRFYAALEGFPWYYRDRKWEHRKALQDIPEGGRVLDIGCGEGAFLELAVKKRACCTGLELNEVAVGIGRTRGLNIVIETVEEHVRHHCGVYDAVCAFQVLEHIPSPRSFLKAMCTAVKSGGRVIIGVPNRRSYLRLTYNVLDMPPHHVTRWDAAVFHACEGELPLRLKRIQREPLDDRQTDAWLSAHTELLYKKIPVLRAMSGLVWKWSERLMRRGRLQSLCHGEGLYACFEKRMVL